MRILTTTLCYPRPDSPDLGVFVQRRALALASLGHDIRVVSPQPWCPILRKTRSDPDQMSPLHVRYPRMFSLPLLGRATDGLAYCRALRPAAADLIRQDGRGFDLIDAHFVYPDGVGALLAARRLRVPVVVTVRGKIVSLSRRLGRRAQIRAMLRRVDGIIAVSRSLARCVHDLAGGVIAALNRPWDRSFISAAGSRRTWQHVAREVEAVFHRVLADRRGARVSDLPAQTSAKSPADAQALEVPA